jgi:hypothetical protein
LEREVEILLREKCWRDAELEEARRLVEGAGGPTGIGGGT